MCLFNFRFSLFCLALLLIAMNASAAVNCEYHTIPATSCSNWNGSQTVPCVFVDGIQLESDKTYFLDSDCSGTDSGGDGFIKAVNAQNVVLNCQDHILDIRGNNATAIVFTNASVSKIENCVIGKVVITQLPVNGVNVPLTNYYLDYGVKLLGGVSNTIGGYPATNGNTINAKKSAIVLGRSSTRTNARTSIPNNVINSNGTGIQTPDFVIAGSRIIENLNILFNTISTSGTGLALINSFFDSGSNHTGISIRKNTISSLNGKGISVSNSNPVKILGNTIIASNETGIVLSEVTNAEVKEYVENQTSYRQTIDGKKYGIQVINGSDNVVIKNSDRILGVLAGINVDGSSNITITDNGFINATEATAQRIFLVPLPAQGVVINNSSNTIVSNTEYLYAKENGVVITGGSNNRVEDNYIVPIVKDYPARAPYSKVGILVSNSPSVTLKKNTINDFLNYGISVQNSNNAQITENSVISPNTLSQVGVRVANLTAPTVTGNIVTDAFIGFIIPGVSGTSSVPIKDNVVRCAQDPNSQLSGMSVSSGSNNLNFENNQVRDCDYGIQIAPSPGQRTFRFSNNVFETNISGMDIRGVPADNMQLFIQNLRFGPVSGVGYTSQKGIHLVNVGLAEITNSSFRGMSNAGILAEGVSELLVYDSDFTQTKTGVLANSSTGASGRNCGLIQLGSFVEWDDPRVQSPYENTFDLAAGDLVAISANGCRKLGVYRAHIKGRWDADGIISESVNNTIIAGNKIEWSRTAIVLKNLGKNSSKPFSIYSNEIIENNEGLSATGMKVLAQGLYGGSADDRVFNNLFTRNTTDIIFESIVPNVTWVLNPEKRCDLGGNILGDALCKGGNAWSAYPGMDYDVPPDGISDKVGQANLELDPFTVFENNTTKVTVIDQLPLTTITGAIPLQLGQCLSNTDCQSYPDLCTTVGQCTILPSNQIGVCTYSAIQCPAGQTCDIADGLCKLPPPVCNPPTCEDNNPCTLDSCNVGVCENIPKTCGADQVCDPTNGQCVQVQARVPVPVQEVRPISVPDLPLPFVVLVLAIVLVILNGTQIKKR